MSHGFELEGLKPATPPPAGGLTGLAARGLAGLNRAILGLSMLALLAAALVLTGSVFLRYYLHVPTDWQDEAAVFLLVGATFLCGAYVQEQRSHVGIESLASLLPPWADRLRRLFCDAASCLFCTFFAWKSWTLFHEAFVEGQTTSSAWAPPLWIPYGLMATGMTLLALQLLVQTLSYFSHVAASKEVA
ncbi:TRAP transporter small permease [Oryzomicrobium sp.]|uniref:TRAP transporter small permease n=1 Tax=Oryzomicrobium sp. TaxID=1911578 RepID=UPI0025EC0705|nr:TRAP transporter small permease [Oryzomicrobium sp.]MCE1243423.1 TRAP transporter small permease [Oryzomicrobium sp.]